MSEYIIDGALLTNIADAVRSVDGSSSTLTPAQMATRLNAVKTSIGAALLALTGNNASTLSVNVGDGQYYHYRAKMTDVDGVSAYSDAAMLSVAGYIAINKQPVDVMAVVGDTVRLTVEAVGDGLTYQWQTKLTADQIWMNTGLDGAKTDTLTFSPTDAYEGRKYRCVIADSNGNTVVTNEVTLTVGTIAIRKQPVDVTAAVGDTVAFSVEAVGDGLTYQWQYFGNTATSWGNIPTGWTGYNTNTLTFNVTENRALNLYRCVITDSNGNSITTNEVTLSIASNVNITTQPQNVEVNIGDTATFTIEAENVATYQWQVSTDSGTTWRDIPLADAKYTVNSGNTVHDLAELIAGAGGGSASGVAKVATGTVSTSVTRLSKLEIVHGLGVAPDFAMLYVETSVFDKRGVMGAIIFKLSDGYDLYINAGTNSSGASRGVYFSSKGGFVNTNLDETKVTFKSELIMSGSNSSTTVNFDTYSTYRWIVGVYA